MSKLSMLLMLIACLVAGMLKMTQSYKEEQWAVSFKRGKQSKTTLKFFFHDTLSGKNPTAIRVAQPLQPYQSSTFFGVMMMTDDPLTVTSDPKSKLVGRAQGFYGSAGQEEIALLMAMSLSFTDGVYNGSTISVLGKNPIMNPVRELPVVAGTGLFRMARGYAIANTRWYDATTGDAIVAYNVTLFH
ncbi:hypothetical protein L6164_037606 [Bauhinia variegata]|uniref:Uncharacterized protein n=1 Tax=Bauhinia variegata TaxID=167791 RepID=A0ACB9KKH6_BAUVA|nr:hypothetical protein L6164_037606 [Bauhinia variegata]